VVASARGGGRAFRAETRLGAGQVYETLIDIYVCVYSGGGVACSRGGGGAVCAETRVGAGQIYATRIYIYICVCVAVASC